MLATDKTWEHLLNVNSQWVGVACAEHQSVSLPIRSLGSETLPLQFCLPI